MQSKVVNQAVCSAGAVEWSTATTFEVRAAATTWFDEATLGSCTFSGYGVGMNVLETRVLDENDRHSTDSQSLLLTVRLAFATLRGSRRRVSGTGGFRGNGREGSKRGADPAL